MRAKPSSNTRSSKTSRSNTKSHGVSNKGVVKKGSKAAAKTALPDLSVLRQPVDTSVCGLKQAVKVFETGTPEVLHFLTYDCDVVYECKVCRNLFRSIANFISHKRIYCTRRYSPAQDLRSNKEGECTLILGETQERFPTRITARKDLTSIIESLGCQNATRGSTVQSEEDNVSVRVAAKKATTIHLEPIENTSYGVFQTVLKPDADSLMGNQVNELQKLLSQNEVILGPDGRILENGLSDVHLEEAAESEANTESNLLCSSCNVRFANRKTMTRHMRIMHETVRASYSCPTCKNLFANPWSVYRHLYKVHKKTNEQVRRLRTQIRRKVEKPIANLATNKKNSSPSRNKPDSEHHNRLQLQQDNKEWMDHFEDDWELQRCGGCGRKFERKAALLSHAQICQKRILAYSRIKQKYQGTITSTTTSLPIVALTPLPCSKKPVPKPSPEKKIGIQVRMNYCKSGSQVSERAQTCTRSVLGDESDLEATSVDGRDNSFREGSVLDHFLKNTNLCHASNGLEKVDSYLNNSTIGVDKIHCYNNSSPKQPSNVGRSKNLEEKCLQLRSALEIEGIEPVKNETKIKDEISAFFDNNIDNTSESNISAVSSLSSQSTPVVDKGYVCEVEESIDVRKGNVSRSPDNVPSTEADSTSVSNGNGLFTASDCHSHSYTENTKYTPNGEVTCEEVSTSVISDEVSHSDSNLLVDSSCRQDDEISIDLKPEESPQNESKDSIKEIELESTISILTRNQLKAICKDDLLPDSQEASPNNIMKKRSFDFEMESATREVTKKKLSKYIDDNQCTVCLKKCKTLYQAYRHIRTHTQWKRYECLYNGCTFQTFLKSACLHHVTLHTKNSNSSSLSLVGKINPSKWNLKIIKLKPTQSKTDDKINTVIGKKDIASKKIKKALISQKLAKTLVSQKLAKTASRNLAKTLASKKLVRNAKTINRLPQQPPNPPKSIKSKENANIVSKKPKIQKLVNRVSVKQKLLTDYKHFNRGAKINGKGILHNRKNKKTNEQTPKIKIVVNSSKSRKFKSSPIENGNTSTEALIPNTGNPVIKKRKLSTSNLDEPKMKLSVIKKERRDEIIVNNISLDSSEPSIGRGRASRASSRKSSVNSVDQPRGKSVISAVVKAEDSNTFLNAPLNFESQDSIHNPEIIDGSSLLEEEESQESDRPVDVTHLNKLVMEVIFGPSSKPAQITGRPVRNKSRPKRDNDFILGSQKEGEKEVVEAKSATSKKVTKAVSDSKLQTDTSKKSK